MAIRPYIAETWSVEDAGEILEGSTGVPLAGWVELARAFVDDLRSGHRASSR